MQSSGVGVIGWPTFWAIVIAELPSLWWSVCGVPTVLRGEEPRWNRFCVGVYADAVAVLPRDDCVLSRRRLYRDVAEATLSSNAQCESRVLSWL